MTSLRSKQREHSLHRAKVKHRSRNAHRVTKIQSDTPKKSFLRTLAIAVEHLKQVHEKDRSTVRGS